MPFALTCPRDGASPLVGAVTLVAHPSIGVLQDVGVVCNGAVRGAEQRAFAAGTPASNVSIGDCGSPGVRGISGAFNGAGLCWVRAPASPSSRSSH